MAKPYPDWVPTEVISFYEGLKTLPDGCTHTLDADKLLDAIQSADMQRAWAAINTRGHLANPTEFAQSILDVACMARYMKKYATTDEIVTYHEAANHVRDIATKLKSTVKKRVREELRDDSGFVPGRYFGIEPIKALYRAADQIDSIAGDMEEARAEMTAFVGKPEDGGAKRHYVIRLLSTETTRLYGTPLHEVVASTSSVILGEFVDPENHVRALLKTSKQPPPSILGG